MKSMTIIEVNKEEIHKLPEENISGIFLPRTKFSSASIGIVKPYECQKKHYHNRVDDGYEIIFIYSGKCVLMGEEESRVFNVDKDGPVFVAVPSRTIAYIKNVGENEVRFFTVFVPGLDINELHFIEDQKG